MAASEGPETPPGVSDANAETRQQSESSDEDDQFTDAQSGPASPRGVSPAPKARIDRVLVSEAPRAEAPDTDTLEPGLEEDDSDDDDSKTPPATALSEAPSTVVQGGSDAEAGSTAGEAEDAAPDVEAGANGERRAVQHDEFGDEFDDFEEGGQDDDFDDFDDGFQQPPPAASGAQPSPSSQPSVALPFPIPDFDGLSPAEVLSSTESFLAALFPPDDAALAAPPPPPPPKDRSLFSTPRAAPLWSQLVAPPPLAPPDWIRSRTRRLFLVSLGVPVDLDEILPASKQKKLVLPSLSAPAASPRTSSDSRSASRHHHHHPDDAAAAAASPSSASPSSAAAAGPGPRGAAPGAAARRGAPPRPELDLVAARYLCTTTDEALNGMTNEELRLHVGKLESMQDAAEALLEYWKKRTDEKIGDREAFEGVIENLVKHARKVRK